MTITFKPGDKVYRKREKDFVKVGTIKSISGNHANVAWEDRGRINGSGFYQTRIKLSDLEPVTDEATRLRKINYWKNRVAHYQKYKIADKLTRAEARLAELEGN